MKRGDDTRRETTEEKGGQSGEKGGRPSVMSPGKKRHYTVCRVSFRIDASMHFSLSVPAL